MCPAPCQGLSAPSFSAVASTSCSTASLASPTTATSAVVQRPMLAREASIWISGASGKDSPKLMVRMFRLAPTASTQSASAAMRRAAECENEPMMPRLSRLPRNMSLPLAVVESIAPVLSARLTSASRAPALQAPWPARTSGLLARSSSAAAAGYGLRARGQCRRCRSRSGVQRHRRGCARFDRDLRMLHVDRQEQCNGLSRPGEGRRIRERSPGRRGAGRRQGADPGRLQHPRAVQLLVVRPEGVRRPRRQRRLAVDDEHGIAGSRGEGGGVQSVGERGSPADAGHAEASRRGRIAVPPCRWRRSRDGPR